MYDTYAKIPRAVAKRAGLTKKLYLTLRSRGWYIEDANFARSLRFERDPVYDENNLVPITAVFADSVEKALSLDDGRGPYDSDHLYSGPAWSTPDGNIRFLRVGIEGNRVYGISSGMNGTFNRKLVDGPRSRYFDVDVSGRQRRVFLEDCVPPIGRPLIVPYRKLLETRNEYKEELRRAHRYPSYVCNVPCAAAYLEAIEYALAVLRGEGKIGDGAVTTGS